jgi:hypothetical protein
VQEHAGHEARSAKKLEVRDVGGQRVPCGTAESFGDFGIHRISLESSQALVPDDVEVRHEPSELWMLVDEPNGWSQVGSQHVLQGWLVGALLCLYFVKKREALLVHRDEATP